MGKTIALVEKAPKTPPRSRLAPDEELFSEGDCVITCRACGVEEKVFLDHPALLCANCLFGLGDTARRVADTYASTMAAFFEASKELHARTRDNAWYVKTEAARGDMDLDPALFTRAWEAARLEGGEKQILIELREAMDAAADQMRQAELRYIAAIPELAAARAAFGEPVDVI